MNGYKYTHMTNSCYKFSGSAINRQDALANTSSGFSIFSLSSSEEKHNVEEKYGMGEKYESSTQPYSKVHLFQMFCYQCW